MRTDGDERQQNRSRLLLVAEVQVGSRRADGADKVVGDNATAKILAEA